MGTFQNIHKPLHFRGADLFNAIGIKLTTLPVVEGKACGIGDGLLALSYTQAAETAGVIVKLVIVADNGKGVFCYTKINSSRLSEP